MQIQSEKGYNQPKIASFYEVNIPNSEPFDIAIGPEGGISIALGAEPYQANMPELLTKKPLLKGGKYWILEKRWACVFYPEWDTPLYFNPAGKKICLLCNGSHTVQGILEELVKASPEYNRVKVTQDAVKFIFLLKKLKLLSFKRIKS